MQDDGNTAMSGVENGSATNHYSNKVLSMNQMRRFRSMIIKSKDKNVPRSDKLKNDLRMERARVDINKKLLRQMESRLKAQHITEAMSFTVLGDEYSVRLELDLHFHEVNDRCLTTGRTLLCEAAARGHFPIVSMLVKDFHADVNIPSLLGKSSPLHLAVANDYRQVVALLLTHSAEVNAIDKYGNAPLHLVKSVNILRLLLKFGAELFLKNNAGLVPAEYYTRITNPDKGYNSEVGFEFSRVRESAIELRRS